MKKLLFSIFLVLAVTGWGDTYAVSAFCDKINGMINSEGVKEVNLTGSYTVEPIKPSAPATTGTIDLKGKFVFLEKIELNDGEITIIDSSEKTGGISVPSLTGTGKLIIQGGKVNNAQVKNTCITKANGVSYVALATGTISINNIDFNREAVKSALGGDGYLIEATDGYPAVVLGYNWSLTNFNIALKPSTINEAVDRLYNTPAPNGLTYYENYVLGLDPAVAPAPAKIVRSSCADRFSFSVVGGPDLSAYNTDSAVRPLYQLQVGDGSGAFTDFGPAAADLSEVAAELPPSTSPARHYRAKIVYERVR